MLLGKNRDGGYDDRTAGEWYCPRCKARVSATIQELKEAHLERNREESRRRNRGLSYDPNQTCGLPEA
jgi:ribosomal protein L44E